MIKKDLKLKAEEIINKFKNDYSRDGLRSYYDVGKNISYGDLLYNDLGDYLPFIAYFGNDEFCNKEIRNLKNNLKNGLLFRKNYSLAFDHTDLLLGLIEHYKIKKDYSIINLAEEITNNVLKNFYRKDVINAYHIKYFKLPIVNSIDNTFIELLIDLYEVTKKEKYLETTRYQANYWLNTEFYKKEKLFSNLNVISFKYLFSKFAKVKRNLIRANLMKNNTNSLFALLELYKINKDEELKKDIYSMINSINKNFLDDNIYYQEIELKNNKIIRDKNLTCNFAMIDLLCDCYHTFKDKKFLINAENVAEKWLELQGMTGLFPMYLDKEESMLDSETDMIIALMKLYELTKNINYRKSAVNALDGVLRYHYTNKGYVQAVNINDGSVIDNRIKIKFNALFLKALILFIEDKSIYNNKNLFKLLRDR